MDCGSGKYKKKFLKVERRRERQKLRQESEQLSKNFQEILRKRRKFYSNSSFSRKIGGSSVGAEICF